MTVKQLIQEYVNDHFKHFGFYPYDVEVDGQIYSYGNYWSILDYNWRDSFPYADCMCEICFDIANREKKIKWKCASTSSGT